MTTDACVDAMTEVAEALSRVRYLLDAAAPFRRWLAQLDGEARAAAAGAAAAGLQERRIASLLGADGPAGETTPGGWMSEPVGPPLPPPSAEDEAWALHAMATALAGMAARLEGRRLPDTPPTSAHAAPRPAARRAREALDDAVARLAGLGAALRYDAGRE